MGVGVFRQEDPLGAALPERLFQLFDADNLLLRSQLPKRRRYLWGCLIQNVHTRVYYTQLSGKVNKFYREFSRFCQISFPVCREFIPVQAKILQHEVRQPPPGEGSFTWRRHIPQVQRQAGFYASSLFR